MSKLSFESYQESAHSTSMYPDTIIHGTNSEGETFYTTARFVYPALGIAGEAGEVAEKVKKILRNNNGTISRKDVEELGKELGDVLWYIAELCSVLGLELEDVARLNLAKLFDRKARNVIKSKGDNR